MAKEVVIVGGGVAGIFVLRNLLAKKDKVGEGMHLTLIKRERSGWESVCGLPFALRGWYEIGLTEIQKPQFFQDQGVDFRTETEVVQINVAEGFVTLDTAEVLKYDYLVLATGRTPSMPAVVEQAKLEGVYTFNDEDDAREIEAAMNAEGVEHAFVRGRGINGLQAAVAFATKGLKTTVLGGPPSLLPSALDPDMGGMLKEWLEKQGIRFILERKPLTALKGDGGQVKSVVVGDEEIPADIMVIALGAAPNADLAKDPELETGESGGFVTDSAMHVRKGGCSLNNVYAVGDCVEVIDGITHRPRLSQFASTAVVQALVICENILGELIEQSTLYSPYAPCISPSIADIGGLLVGAVGVTSEAAARAGIKTVNGKATKLIKARYFPGATKLTMKLIFDAFTRKLIGAQLVGEATVAERINELAVAIYAGLTAAELRNMERCFDPSLSQLVDVTTDAAEKALESV
ncbi:MAG: FAD-dependent oxidoreductase [Methanosarcinales archaeon]|nr:FAD-dependent oxidoreductase [Methanosarcinales archaeon]